MKFIKTELKGVMVIEPDLHGDHRGWFMESYNQKNFEDNGLFVDFVQDNHSFSKEKGVIRGLHFQKQPSAQAKLVRCTRGAILDVAVDLKKGSETYLKWVTVELSEENHKQLFIPRGFAHGFVTLTDNVMVQYKTDNFYNKNLDRSIRYDDSEIGIPWNVKNPIVSKKDSESPTLKDSDFDFTVKVLVTGAEGQLGQDVLKALKSKKLNCMGCDRQDFDIADYESARKFILSYQPDIVIHCAAYTAVDKAEENQKLCHDINVKGSENIAKICAEADSKLIYVSTDYVYDEIGLDEIEVDRPTNPRSVYGKTKLEGENVCRKYVQRLYVVRTSWVFGANGNNFVKTMLKLANSTNEIKVVNDQIGSPTYTPDLADFLVWLSTTDRYGTYHFTNNGFCTWYEFAQEIFRQAGVTIDVKPVTTEDFGAKAIRPKNSKLSKKCLTEIGYPMPQSWQEALSHCLKELEL